MFHPPISGRGVFNAKSEKILRIRKTSTKDYSGQSSNPNGLAPVPDSSIDVMTK